MAKTLVFPSTHPGGAVLSIGDKLLFELTTNSAAPIFSFKVDAVLIHDASTAPHTIVGNLNKYKWEHPTMVPKPGEVGRHRHRGHYHRYGNLRLQDLPEEIGWD